jgi:hypothetical protein
MLFLVCLTLKMETVYSAKMSVTVYNSTQCTIPMKTWNIITVGKMSNFITSCLLFWLDGWGSSHGNERFITSHLMCILNHSIHIQVTEHCIKPYSPLQHDESFQRSVYYVFSMSVKQTLLRRLLVILYNVLGSLQAYRICIYHIKSRLVLLYKVHKHFCHISDWPMNDKHFLLL